jgi:hypothetical protein
MSINRSNAASTKACVSAPSTAAGGTVRPPSVNTRRCRYCQEIGVAARKLTAQGAPSGPGGAPLLLPTYSPGVHLKHVIVERFQRVNVEVVAVIPGPVPQFPDELGGRPPVEARLHLRAVALLSQHRPGGQH